MALAQIDIMLRELAERAPGHQVGVLCVGVDSLKSVNEALTHAAGDQVMVAIADRLATVEGNPSQLARGSGDEFWVLVPDMVSGADAGAIAEQLRLAAHGPVMIGARSFEPTVSVGIASGGPDAHADELLRDAALAMRRAKDNGRDRIEFSQAKFAQEAQHRVDVEDGIRIGLRSGQFVPWYQPVVNLADGEVVGYEALVRWVRPCGSVVSPADFLPVAERTSLMSDLDRAVLQQSVALLKKLPAPAHVAVNVSANTLAREDYAHWVREALSHIGADPTRLHVEVTETALLSVTNRVDAMMRDLADFGIGWYVDDFGTGYSSIAHLRELPISGLKLDLSFAAGIGSGDRPSEHIAAALAGLAVALDLDTVAEGVETPEVSAILNAQGWKHAQGWLFGHPAPLTLGQSGV